MIERFPYGKAPFWLLALALASSLLLIATRQRAAEGRPELTFATFATQHYDAYKRVLPEFERKHGVKVGMQLVDMRALQTRLQNAMLAKAEVPDVVEVVSGSMGYFTRGPIKDVGLVDLSERIAREDYRRRIVPSRFSQWETRGKLFGIPHDVHPVMLVYRADLVEALGIRVEELDTWEAFAAAGRKVLRDLNGDGTTDRYMIDLPAGGGSGLSVLMLQQGVSLFGPDGRVAFDDPRTVDTMLWYLRQVRGPQRIATDCGWGQPFSKGMMDGVALFFVAPDWRTHLMEMDVPSLSGKLKLMPLPAWQKGGRRTSVWGGTGIAITKQSKRPDLAWELVKFLYFNPEELGKRFASTNILPPFQDAWDLPEFHTPSAFFSGQQVGAEYARMAPQTPPVWDSPYSTIAEGKVNEVFERAAQYYERNGEQGLREVIERELTAGSNYVKRIMDRNVLAGAH